MELIKYACPFCSKKIKLNASGTRFANHGPASRCPGGNTPPIERGNVAFWEKALGQMIDAGADKRTIGRIEAYIKR